MNIEQNEDLNKEVEKNTELKNLIVEFVGDNIKPEDNLVTVEHVIEVFTEQFPELLLVLAEENWLNGYTQALTDVGFVNKRQEIES